MVRNYTIKTLLSFALIFIHCGTKDQSPVNKVVVDSDTLTLEMIGRIAPDLSDRAEYTGYAAVRYLLSSRCKKDSVALSLQADLLRQLTLHCTPGWDEYSAGILIKAALNITEKLDSAVMYQNLLREIDALYAESVRCPEGEKITTPFSTDSTEKSIKAQDVESMSQMYSDLLGLGSAGSRILAEFTVISDTTESAQIDQETVKRLVYSKKHQPAAQTVSKATGDKVVKQLPDNDHSRRALRYRDHKSVKDSIAKHLPNLIVLYQQHIRRSDSRDGTVWVNFRVGSDGTVETAEVHRSGIDDQEFIVPLVQYLQSIRFKPIPDSIGTMHFEFPFQFSADR